jgi:sortase A
MRRLLRLLGTLLIVAGLATLGWAALVWQWQDPLTAVYEWREQRALDGAYERRARAFALPAAAGLAEASPADVRAAAGRYRRALREGEAVGVLTIGRLGLRKLVVDGTTHDSLARGPGRDRRTALPGEGRLIYVAGHRTTYGAPFSHIDELRRGDYVRFEVPYGTFTYRVTENVVVPASDVGRLDTRGREELALQACHPRFFASHRYIAYARFVDYEPAAVGAAAAVAAPAR